MTTLLILSFLSAVAAIAYVIGRWGRIPTIVTSSISAVVTKEKASQVGGEENHVGGGCGRGGGGDIKRTGEQLFAELPSIIQRREQLYLTSLGNDKHDVDADIDDDCDSVSQLKMSSSSSSSPSSLPAELRALLDHERSRRRAAEDWATFLVATLDSYVRASNTYERRLAESGLGPQAAHIGCSRCRGGDGTTAAKERGLGKRLVQRNSGGRVTEQPPSRDDWESMVKYNEKIIQQHNLGVTEGEQLRKVENISSNSNHMMKQLRPVSWRTERPNFKPPKPPKPNSPQQAPRRLLPVQQFLNRQLEREDYGMKSNAVLLHGQWSPVKHRVPAEKVNNSMANNELLKLLPTQLLPVHRHLQRQAGKEQEQVPYTESSDVEPTKDSDPQLCTSSPPERNFQKTFSVSVDSANTISEGNGEAEPQVTNSTDTNLLDADSTSGISENPASDVIMTSSAVPVVDTAAVSGESASTVEDDLDRVESGNSFEEQTVTTMVDTELGAPFQTEPVDDTNVADAEPQAKQSTDVNLNVIDAESTSGIPENPDNDVTVTSSAGTAVTIGVTGDVDDGFEEDLGQSGTMMDFEKQSLQSMMDITVSDHDISENESLLQSSIHVMVSNLVDEDSTSGKPENPTSDITVASLAPPVTEEFSVICEPAATVEEDLVASPT